MLVWISSRWLGKLTLTQFIELVEDFCPEGRGVTIVVDKVINPTKLEEFVCNNERYRKNIVNSDKLFKVDGLSVVINKLNDYLY